MKWRFLWMLSLLICRQPLWAADILRLPIGDPARKDKRVSLVLDGITDTRTGETLSPTQLVERLRDVDLLLVGEDHTSVEVHQIQERIILALAESGRPVVIGLEMFPYTEQEHLDHWNQGFLTETGFVNLADWYTNWGYNWRYYRSIFLSARDRGIPMFAVNTPRSVVSAVREKGFDGLSDEEKEHIPETIDTDDPEHLELFKAYFEGEDDEEGFHASLSEEQLQGMFDAQCTWDATMAHNATRILDSRPESDPIMVVLVGAGHVAYGLGIQRQAAQWFDGKTASLIPLPVRNEGEPIREVQASYADYLWGYPPEPDTAFPTLGVSTHADKESGRLKIIFVENDTPAKRSGLKTGDILLELEGRPLTDRSMLNRAVSSLQWGDSLRFTVQREGETQAVTVHFRRVLE